MLCDVNTPVTSLKHFHPILKGLALALLSSNSKIKNTFQPHFKCFTVTQTQENWPMKFNLVSKGNKRKSWARSFLLTRFLFLLQEIFTSWSWGWITYFSQKVSFLLWSHYFSLINQSVGYIKHKLPPQIAAVLITIYRSSFIHRIFSPS